MAAISLAQNKEAPLIAETVLSEKESKVIHIKGAVFLPNPHLLVEEVVHFPNRIIEWGIAYKDTSLNLVDESEETYKKILGLKFFLLTDYTDKIKGQLQIVIPVSAIANLVFEYGFEQITENYRQKSGLGVHSKMPFSLLNSLSAGLQIPREAENSNSSPSQDKPPVGESK